MPACLRCKPVCTATVARASHARVVFFRAPRVIRGEGEKGGGRRRREGKREIKRDKEREIKKEREINREKERERKKERERET